MNFPSILLLLLEETKQAMYNLTQTMLANAHASCCLSASGNI